MVCPSPGGLTYQGITSRAADAGVVKIGGTGDPVGSHRLVPGGGGRWVVQSTGHTAQSTEY
jgi:hypothetical protein